MSSYVKEVQKFLSDEGFKKFKDAMFNYKKVRLLVTEEMTA